MDFDFIIVGAGPIGSFLSKSLVEEGYSVGIFERKKEIGKGVICSGIIGKDPYNNFNLPVKAIIRGISSLKVFSPSLIELEHSNEEPFAYIADRKIFDNELFGEALKAGVGSFLGSKVLDILTEKDRISIKYLREGRELQKSARCIVIASGADFSLHRKTGISVPDKLLWGNKLEASGGNGESAVEVYILNKPDLSSFGWIIPLNGHTRIGALSESSSQEPLRNLISKSNGRFAVDISKIERAPIACGNSKKIFAERIVAVGEAAGQVKTTTGGGIYYGLVGASIAKEVLVEAAKANDFSAKFLSQYESIWKRKMGSEIENGIVVRNLASKMTPKMVDSLFEFLSKNPSIKDELEGRFRFDYHKDIIKFGVKFLLDKIPGKLLSFSSFGR
jgi:digeranylgeranylglycerophospholipid reductase